MTSEPERGTHVHVGGDVAHSQVVVGHHNVVFHVEGSYIASDNATPPTVKKRTTPVARPLPRLRGELFGRDTELTLLTQWVEEGWPVELHGAAGVGKSALLARFAAERAKDGHDVVYLHAAGLDPADVLQQLFQSCYDAPDYIPDRNHLKRLMGPIHAVIMVDDYEGTTEQLTELLDALPSSDLLISTTDRIAWSRGQSLELRGLSAEPALALLTAELGRDLDDATEVALQLFRAANGHPRALMQAAAWLRDGGDTTAVTDPQVLQRTLLIGLPERSRRVVTALCAAGGATLTPTLCQAMIGGTDARDTLGELVGLAVAEGRGTRFRLALDPQAVAEAWAPTVPNIAEFVFPLLDWVNTGPAPKLIADAAPVLTKILDAAITDGRAEPACALARAIAPVLAATLQWGAWGTVLRLGETAAAACGSHNDITYFRNEDRLRRKTSGLAAATTIAGATGGGVLFGHVAAKWTTGKTLKAAITSHPAAATGIAAVVVAAGVAGATVATSPPPQVASHPAAASVASQPTDGITPVTLPPQTTEPSVPAPDISGSTRNLPTRESIEFNRSLSFQTAAGKELEERIYYGNNLICEQVLKSWEEGDAENVFEFNVGNGCYFDVRFIPKQPDTLYEATLFVSIIGRITGHTGQEQTSAYRTLIFHITARSATPTGRPDSTQPTNHGGNPTTAVISTTPSATGKPKDAQNTETELVPPPVPTLAPTESSTSAQPPAKN